MKQFSPAVTLGLLIAFLAGFVSHLLYQRWNPATAENPTNGKNSVSRLDVDPPSFRVTFLPTSPAQIQADMPLVQARELEKSAA